MNFDLCAFTQQQNESILYPHRAVPNTATASGRWLLLIFSKTGTNVGALTEVVYLDVWPDGVVR